MLHDLFINMTILISFISLGSQLIKNHNINSESSIWLRILLGIYTGVLGTFLMTHSVHIANNTIVDMRNIAIIMVSIHGGILPTVICSLIMSLFRIIYFGISTSSVAGVFVIIITSIGCILITKFHTRSNKKWKYSTIFSLVVTSVVLMRLLKGKVNLPSFLLIYWVILSAAAIITYYYVHYCLTANSLFRKLQQESTKDFLTGLNNVRQFDALFNNAAKNAIEKNERLSLLMVDIDFFKKVNDTYGHHNGDIVLAELSKVLTASSRSFDIVSRNGGEEFTVLLLDCQKDAALKIAERTRTAVEVHDFILSDGTKINITISIGAATYPETVDDLDKLLEASDVSLYTAKRTGRNKVCSQ